MVNSFGALLTNNDKSTGIDLPSIDAGNLSLYTIGAQQGLGAPPLQINGVNAGSVLGLINLNGATSDGDRTVIAGLPSTASGDVFYSHLQTGRDAAAIAVEIRAQSVPVPTSYLLMMIGLAGLCLRSRS